MGFPGGQFAGTPAGSVDVGAAVDVVTGLAVVGGTVATVVTVAGVVACVVAGAGTVVWTVTVVPGRAGACGAVVALLGCAVVAMVAGDVGATNDGAKDGGATEWAAVAPGVAGGAVTAGSVGMIPDSSPGTVSTTNEVPVTLPSGPTTTTTRVTVCGVAGAIDCVPRSIIPRMFEPPSAAKHTVPMPNVAAAAAAVASANRRSMLHPASLVSCCQKDRS
jgi:hypothetical protein